MIKCIDTAPALLMLMAVTLSVLGNFIETHHLSQMRIVGLVVSCLGYIAIYGLLLSAYPHMSRSYLIVLGVALAVRLIINIWLFFNHTLQMERNPTESDQAWKVVAGQMLVWLPTIVYLWMAYPGARTSFIPVLITAIVCSAVILFVGRSRTIDRSAVALVQELSAWGLVVIIFASTLPGVRSHALK